MLKLLLDKVRPGRGFAHFFHLCLVAILPVIMLVLVRIHFEALALCILVLSKWRMFAVRPHYWLSNIRTNAIDIIVGASFLVCMSASDSYTWQLVWMALYEAWLLIIKPRSSVGMVSLQAVIGQFLGFSSIFIAFPEAPAVVYVAAFWAIAYVASRHFFSSFDESQARLLASVWAFFAASLMWVQAHWLLFIDQIAQPAILLSVLGYGLAGLYYLHHTDRLSSLVRRQIIIVMCAVVLTIIVFSDWGDKAI